MKKFLFFALAAAFAFTSCTQDETLATAQNGAIDFAVAADNATRSNIDPSITTESIQDFAVYGWMKDANNVGGDVFNDEVVYRATSGWTYTNTQYWTPNTYYFAALAPAFKEDATKRNWTVKTEQNELGIGTVTFENKDAAQDLLYWANILDNTGKAVENAPVSVVFHHLLSKVKFTFVNEFENALTTIKVSNLKITNAYTKGTLDLTLADWWTKPEWVCEGEQTFGFGNVTTTKEGKAEAIALGTRMESDKEVLLFPAADKTYKVEFTVTVLNGEAIAAEYTHKVELTTTFNMGFSYNIKAALNAANVNPAEELKPIEFEVTAVEGWDQTAPEVELTKNAETEAELVAAINSGASIVTLTNDITLNETLNIEAKNAVVLNLNGKTLTNKVDNAKTDVIVVAADATLTINGEGTIEAVTGNDGYAVIADGTLIINGGTFKSGVDVANAPNAVIYARNNGKVYVNGGYFPNDNASKFVLNKKDADRATTVIEVRGGKFGTFNPADNAAENAGTNFVAEGYKSVEVEANVWEVSAE